MRVEFVPSFSSLLFNIPYYKSARIRKGKGEQMQIPFYVVYYNFFEFIKLNRKFVSKVKKSLTTHLLNFNIFLFFCSRVPLSFINITTTLSIPFWTSTKQHQKFKLSCICFYSLIIRIEAFLSVSFWYPEKVSTKV